MASLKIMGRTGHTEYTWDNEAAVTGDPDTRTLIEEMEREMNTAMQAGAAAFRIGQDGTTERIHTFDPEAHEIIVALPIRGGAR
jgi:hypothetical protein